MFRNHCSLLLYLFLLLPAALSGQAIAIEGSLRDRDAQPLGGVRISLLNQPASAVTDAEGKFRLEVGRPGDYLLLASKAGYRSLVQRVAARLGHVSRLDLTLEAQASFLWQEVLITAQRAEEDPFLTPASVNVLSRNQLSQINLRSLPEALIGSIGVWMQKTNHGGGSPYVRGLTGNQTLLLVDGIRLNNSTYRYGPNQYLVTLDPLSLERVEVIRGSGSVQYGSDALGGVVQALTREPAFSEAFRFRPGGQLRYMSGGMDKTARGEFELSSPRTALLMGFNYKDFGDIVAGGDLGTLQSSSYTELSGDFKFRWQTGRRSRLTLAWQQVEQRNVGRYDQVAQRGFQRWEFDPQIRRLAYARWEYFGEKPLFSSLRITASNQLSDEGRVRQRQNDPVQVFEQDRVLTSGLSAELRSVFRPGWEASSGFDLYYDQIGSSAYRLNLSDSSRTDLRGLYPDGATAGSASLFSLHTVVKGAWRLSGGLRFNAYDLRAEDATFGDVSLRPANIVGQVAAGRQLGQAHYVYLTGNSGFRAPNINDMSSFGPFDSGIEVPAQGLQPERSYTAELGYKLRSKPFRLGASAYYTRLSNLIVRVPATYLGDSTYQGEAVFQKRNVAEAYIYGAEAEGEWSFAPDFTLAGGIAWAYGQNVTQNEPISRIPPLNGRLALRWQPGTYWLQAEALAAGKQDRLSGGDARDHRIPAGGTPGWQVLHLSGGWRFSERISLSATLQNVLDAAYRLHGSGVEAYGRSFWIALRIE